MRFSQLAVRHLGRYGVYFVWLAITGLIALTQSGQVLAQDYAREKRVAAEILPTILVGDPVWIKAKSGNEFLALYAKGDPKKRAVVLVHSVGQHPDAQIIGLLRQHLNELGHTTLSIQMPIQSSEAKLEDYYPTVFGDAKDRMVQSLQWLAQQGIEKPALLSHTMGSWMVNEMLDDRHQRNEWFAWICMSLTGSYSWTTRSYALPILDVYAQNDIAVVVNSALRRRTALLSTGSRQLMVGGAEASYAGHDRALAAEVSAFLR